MNLKSPNFKIYLASAYLIVLFTGIYFFWTIFDLSDLTSYQFIKENKALILQYKTNNIFFMTIISFAIVVILNLLLSPMLLPTLIIGFIFGKWLGTLILVFGNTLGGVLLYILAKTFFSELIEEKFSKKFSKFVKYISKNEVMYFMGGGGAPFPVQNILPVIFNMSIKNYIIATFFGIVPTTFVTAALGSGIENIIEQNAELNFMAAFLSPEIYLPIAGFFLIFIIAFIIRKFYFNNK